MAKKKRPPGRPPLPQNKRAVVLSITLRPDVLAWVDRQAARRGVSRSAVVQEAVAAARKGKR